MNPQERARKILEIDSSDQDHADAAREIYEHAVHLAVFLLGAEAARGRAGAVTPEQREEARAKALGIVDELRAGLPLEQYTDRQIWQAVITAGSTWKDLVALVFLDHVMRGTTPPSCPYELDPA